MKTVRTMITAGAIAGMLASTGAMAAEASNTASALSLKNAPVSTAQVRHSADVEGKSKLAQGAIIPLVLAAGIVAGGIIIAVDDDDDAPDSAG